MITNLPQRRGNMGEVWLFLWARAAGASTHLWANVTGSGHAVQEVEEECLVSSLETVARGRREEGDTWLTRFAHELKKGFNPWKWFSGKSSVLTLEVKNSLVQYCSLFKGFYGVTHLFQFSRFHFNAAETCDLVTNYFTRFNADVQQWMHGQKNSQDNRRVWAHL